MPQHNQPGTGKHPHKGGGEPSHHSKGTSHGGEHTRSGKSASGMSPGQESPDVKSREYRDREGNIHHSTHPKDERSRH